MSMQLETLLWGDNYIYVLIEGGMAAVVDPGAAGPVRNFLDERGIELDLILITHNHSDHTGGGAELRQAMSCRVAGPPGGWLDPDQVVRDGDVLEFAGQRIETLSVPGHTAHDRAYYLPEQKAVFTGDVLFACGCGRVNTGDMAGMWSSLRRLRALPDDTRLFGGHDYTCENLEFAANLEPHHAAVQARLKRFRVSKAAGTPCAPSTLKEEKQTNPFLRCDDPSLAESLGMTGQSPADVFAVVRGRKDRW